MSDKDLQGVVEVIEAIQKLGGGFASEFETWLEALGFQFLEEVQNEIIRQQVVDTRRLLNSFGPGSEDGVWELDRQRGVLTLEVGTNVEYAGWVNDGHWTINPESGKRTRWVPGYWRGDRFIYDPTAKTGMLLKLKWVEGKKFFDTALLIFEQIFQKSIDRKFEEWLKKIW